MGPLTNDPVIRYGALGLIAALFLSFLAVAVHGYWVDPNYQLPTFVAGIIGPVLGALIGLLGAHYGSATATNGVNQGADVTASAIITSTSQTNGNGTTPHA